MFENFQENLHCMNLALNPNGLVISLLIKKRWHLAFMKIYCSRAFLSLFSEVLAKRNKISILTSSATFINNDQPCKDAGLFSEVNQTILSKFVKEKNLKELYELGGAEQLKTFLADNVG